MGRLSRGAATAAVPGTLVVGVGNALTAVTPGWECVPTTAGQTVVSGGTGASPSCGSGTTAVLAPTYVSSGVGGKPTVEFSGLGLEATVAGGEVDSATRGAASVGGGQFDDASGGGAAISGGDDSDASDSFASISGGYNNFATTFDASVSGGEENTASATGASVLGGDSNEATSNCQAIPAAPGSC